MTHQPHNLLQMLCEAYSKWIRLRAEKTSLAQWLKTGVLTVMSPVGTTAPGYFGLAFIVTSAVKSDATEILFVNRQLNGISYVELKPEFWELDFEEAWKEYHELLEHDGEKVMELNDPDFFWKHTKFSRYEQYFVVRKKRELVSCYNEHDFAGNLGILQDVFRRAYSLTILQPTDAPSDAPRRCEVGPMEYRPWDIWGLPIRYL
jgi:hypothetical protein